MAERTGPSYWVDTTADVELPPLTGSLTVDVAVVGGGMAGLVAAHYLARSGLRVCVLESLRLAAQVSGGTTAKVTSLHRLPYARLIRDFGETHARHYGEANQWAIAEIERLAGTLDTDAGFVRCPAYTYAENAEHLREIEDEVAAAGRLGLPASFTRDTELPFPIAGAVRFDDQARFHPRAFLLALARQMQAEGVAIHQHTRVVEIEEGTPCRLRTPLGSVTAAHVLVTTNLPIGLKGGFFARAFPHRHMALAAITPGPVLEGMYLAADRPSRSLRGHQGPEGAVLVAVGEAFKTAHEDAGDKLAALERWVSERYPGADIRWRWGNQDYTAADGVPFVGRMGPLSRHQWTATGFGAWGMTNGVVAARILADALTGRHNPWAATFDSTRLDLKAGGREMLQENLHVAKGWVRERLHRPPAIQPASLRPGEHAVSMLDGERSGLFRDEDGVLHAVSATCPHMGCTLAFNPAERSWDCPCHGSRFGVDGKVLNGPAIRDLPARRV